jgi:hypothetical protein
MSGLRYYMGLFKEGRETDPAAIQDFRAILHSPAFMVKSQAIIASHGRRNLILNAIGLFESLSDEEKTRIRTESAFYTNIMAGVEHRVSVEADSEQSTQPSAVKAKTVWEYNQAIKLDGFERIEEKKEDYADEVLSKVEGSLVEKDFLRRKRIVINGEELQEGDGIIEAFYTKLGSLSVEQAEAEKIAKLCTQALLADVNILAFQRYRNDSLGYAVLARQVAVESDEVNSMYNIELIEGRIHIKAVTYQEIASTDDPNKRFGEIKCQVNLDFQSQKATLSCEIVQETVALTD